jgi:cell wall-associated NlpC family hydrolase
MSVDAVVGRIDQILAMTQQLVEPPPVAPAAPAVAASGSSASSASPGGSPSFSDALASAQTGFTAAPAAPAAAVGGGAGLPQVQSMIGMADSLLGKPYVWGGGHAGFGPSSGYDCSGFVSAVLHAGGYLTQPATTDTLPGQSGILPGPGQFVTIYDRPDGSVPGASGHVIIDIGGQFYESGGETGAWGGGGGVAKIATPTAAYLATFPTVLHPSGL